MKSFHDKLNKEFPETPDSFKSCVNKAVREHKLYKYNKKRFRLSKVFIPLAACIILACGTVAASELKWFQQWMAELGLNRQEAEGLIIHSGNENDVISTQAESQQPSVSSEIGEEPLFTVTDAYYDGATFLFWAKPGDELNELEFGDHVYINGTDNRLEYVVETEEGSGIYQCEITIMNEELANVRQEKLEVKVQVYMPSGERRDFMFTIESDKLRSVDTAAGQHFDLPYATVEVYDLKIAPSNVSFKLKWTVYNKEDFDILRGALFFCEDSSGVRYAPNDLRGNAFCSTETYNEDSGYWEFEQGYELKNFDSSSEYMKYIPAEGGYNEEGAYVEGTEIPREDMSFTIQFK